MTTMYDSGKFGLVAFPAAVFDELPSHVAAAHQTLGFPQHLPRILSLDLGL